jgi:flagellar biosynthesis protein FliR
MFESGFDILLTLPKLFLERMEVGWTFVLLLTRYSSFLTICPGIGMGVSGVVIRLPAIIVFSFTSLMAGQLAPLPDNIALVVGGIVSEMCFGLTLGLIPALIVAGFQTAGQLSSTSMGMGAGQLFDPTFGTSLSELSKLMGDMVILTFLFLNGHHVVLLAVSGLEGEIVPGSFLISEQSIDLLIDRASDIFRVGMLVASPVVVALLLTQFVMGLISKMVPTVNIFIVSFPLTLGIGLILTFLGMPGFVKFAAKEVTGVENSIFVLTEQTEKRPAVD